MDNNEILNKYFEKTLTEEEKVVFENLLKNPDFAEEVAFQRKIKKAITRTERDSLKEKLKNFESQAPSKTSKFPWLYAAASIVLLLGASFWFMNQNKDYDELYASYYETYPNIVEPIVRNNTAEMTLQAKAFTAYEAKEYAKALQYFQTILAKNPHEEYALFYSATSYMELNQLSKASNILNNTTWSKKYAASAIWYQALIELKLENIPKCKKLLQSLAENTVYAAESNDLLSRLE